MKRNRISRTGRPEAKRRARWLVPWVAVIALVAAVPSYVRAYRVDGASDAPSFLVGERIFVIHAAYDVRLPYTGITLFSHARPERGDVVLFRSPDGEAPVFKRVIGCAGDTVEMRDHRLEINGVPLRYGPIDRARFRPVAERNRLGAIVAEETGNGAPHLVTYTPGLQSAASFGLVRVPEDHYFVMGDNRDHSRDSRAYGSIPRRSILGRVVSPNRTGS